MSLLDDLKNQAEVVRNRQRSGAELVEHYFYEIHERLKALHKQLLDLTGALNTVRPDVPRHYYVDGSLVLDGLQQTDYSLSEKKRTIEFHDYFTELQLRARAVGQKRLVVEKESEPVVLRLRDFLWGHALRFDLREVRAERRYIERGVFTIEPDVPIALTITGVPEQREVRLTVRNLEKLGEVSYRYELDEFNDELVEELIKMLLGKPNDFRTRGRHQQRQTVVAHRPEPAPAPVAAPSTPAAPATVPAPEAPVATGGLRGLFRRGS